MSEQENRENLADIAIVGMAGRFPASPSVEALWQNVREGKECIHFFSEEELREAGVDEALFTDPNYVPAHGYIEDIDQFDAGFFDITPREAEVTDPQIRLFLECCWEALENAGCDPERTPGAIGVFAGASNNAYVLDNLITRPDVIESVGYTQAALGNHTDFVATRVSYKLDLKGPSVTVQTACSTSLVATHMACQSLLSGESDVVLAGGVCVTNLKKQGYVFVEGGTNTHDGHVRSFDSAADGMLGGNGVAVVALKRLEDALADGDTIHAVIKGTAINNDGMDKVTFTAPSVNGQCQVILDALDVADVDPASIGMVEAHGTGTPLGDPIEIAALTQAWRTQTDGVGFCRIGSIKSNMGHLDIAAGVTGLIKTALSLKHREIPASLNFERPNPEIDFDASPFVVNTALAPFERGDTPRRAAVSSFGMGGTNAHAILEEAPELEPTSGSRAHQLLLLSARSEEALDAATERLAERLEGDDPPALADVAFTLQVGRKGFDERRAVVCGDDAADATGALRSLDRARSVTETCSRLHRPVAFLFTGQGAQYPGMMRGLYEAEPTFRAALDRCCEALTPLVGRDLRELILPTAGTEEAAADELALTQYTQPSLFAVEWALAQLWMEWGLEPDAMFGHSIGEYTAAALAGVFSLEDALKLVAARGRLIGALPEGGSMLAVHLDEGELAAQLPPGLSIAAVNAPGLCVVSGPEAQVAALEGALGTKDVSTRRLHTSHAFHSSLMDPILDEYRAVVEAVELHAPERRLVSCATGTWLTDAEATDPGYWVDHVRRGVRFADGVATLDDGSERLLLEVGPGATLGSLARLSTTLPVVTSVRHPKEEADDLPFLLRALGEVWANGVDVEWEGFYTRERRRRVPLPTYPFEHESYWVDAGGSLFGGAPAAVAGAPAGLPTTKNPDLSQWFFAPSWRQAPIPLGAGGTRELSKSWLVFLDEGGVGDALVAALEAEGVTPTTVRFGDGFERVDERSFRVAAGDAEDHKQLFTALAEAGGVPTEIVHLANVDPFDGLAADDKVERAFYSLLALGQALSAAPLPGPTRVAVVSRGMQDVLSGTPACPEKALLLGPCKSLRAEIAEVSSTSIDLEAGSADPAGLAARLLAEVRAGATGAADPVVALHGRHRWTLAYEPVPIGETPAAPRLREGGTYLVTGGLGGIGLTLAEELVAAVKANLVLVGRAGLPERDTWDAYLGEHGEEDSVSRQMLAVRALEAAGGQVMVAAADVTDAVRMAEIVDQATARFGGVHGVIHAAGRTGAGLMAFKTREDAAAILAAKVRGTQVLDEVFQGRELDFLFLCSSISTATGIMSGVDYSAANAFLDAYACSRSDDDTWVVAACWDTWKDVGIAMQMEVPEGLRERFEEGLRLGIAPAEGRDAFRRLFAAGLPQVYVSTRDLRLRDEFAATQAAEGSGPDEAGAPAKKGGGRRTHKRPKLSMEFVEPESQSERALADMWADLLGLDRVGANDNFFELGGNSLVMMQVNVRLRSLFGLSMPVRELFELPDVASLAEHIDAILAVSGAGESDEASEEIEEFTL